MAEDTPYKRILVGVDPEGLATHAVACGAGLADKLAAELHLVAAVAVPPSLWPGIKEEELAAMNAAALGRAHDATVKWLTPVIREAGLGDEVPSDLLHVRPGHPAKVILREADELPADLIVIGPHAKRSLLDFGSTARAVLARAKAPVWTQSHPVTPIKKILVPVDFSEHSKLALAHAHALAKAFDAEVHVVHVYEAPLFAYGGIAETVGPTYVVDADRNAARDELERVAAEFPWESVKATSEFVEGSALAVIEHRLKTSDAVVLGTHGRTALNRFLIGSVAYGVLKQSEIPTVVVPGARKQWLIGAEEEGPPALSMSDYPVE